jgi:hypothetical protein
MLEFDNYTFLNNKYKLWYKAIIQKAVNERREYDSLKHERHHALPKCFGGTEDSNNYITLTFKEHYICHLLLTRFTIGKDKMKMSFALHTFFHFNHNRSLKILRGRLYETHKEYFIEACREKDAWTKPEIFKFKHAITKEEYIGTRAEFRKHSMLSSQEIYNLLTKDSKMFHAKQWGVYRNDIQAYSFDKKRIRKPSMRKECQHCKKQIDPLNYAKYHGDKCKLI